MDSTESIKRMNCRRTGSSVVPERGPGAAVNDQPAGIGASSTGRVEKFAFPTIDPICIGEPETIRSGMLHVFEIDQPNRAFFLRSKVIHTAATLSETAALMVKLVLEMRRMSWLVMEGDVLSVRDLPVDRRPTTLVAFLDTRDPAFSASPHSNEGVGASRILNSAFEIEHAGRAVGMHLIRRRHQPNQQKGASCPSDTSRSSSVLSRTELQSPTIRRATGI